MDDAYLWIAERAPDNATKWFNGLEAAIYSLEDFPERCPLAEESKAFDVEIRQLVYGKRVGAYRILFTIVGDAVHILHVRHGRRKRLRGEDS
jgi:plasmid stabilization system protein ParE